MSGLARILKIALLGLALGGLQACGDFEDSPSPRDCDTNADCPNGQICFEDGCGSALDFAVRVTPLNASGHVVQDFNSVSVAKGRVDLALKRAATIEGSVFLKSDSALDEYLALPARADSWFVVQARGKSSNIAGLSFEQPLSKMVKEGSKITFTVPAGSWDISVTPTDPSLPPVYSRTTVAAAQTVDPELVLITGEGLLKLQSQVVKQPSIAWPAFAPTLRIQAIDPSRGTPLSQPVVFEAADNFQIHALKLGGPMTLRVGPDASSLVPAPTKDFLSDASGKFELPLALGDYGDPVELKGKVTDPAGAAIENAEIHLQGQVRGGGSFSVNVRSREGGEFLVKLLPTEKAFGSEPATRYTLTATPPFASPYARAQVRFEVDLATTLAPVVCGPKALLSGTVLGTIEGKQDQPMADVLIHFEGNPEADNPGLSTGDIHTDFRGRFSVDVEPGAYRIVAKPAPEHQLPWASKRVDSAESPIEIRLSDPREVTGAITDWDGKPVANAIVSFFRISRATGADSPPAPPAVYETLSDASGLFTAIVPKAPEATTGDEHDSEPL